MANTYKKLFQQQIPNSPTTLYTVPALTQTILKTIKIVNPSGADATVKLWHDGTGNANLILPAIPILAGGYATFSGSICLETGDTFSAESGTNNALTITAYGDEIT